MIKLVKVCLHNQIIFELSVKEKFSFFSEENLDKLFQFNFEKSEFLHKRYLCHKLKFSHPCIFAT